MAVPLSGFTILIATTTSTSSTVVLVGADTIYYVKGGRLEAEVDWRQLLAFSLLKEMKRRHSYPPPPITRWKNSRSKVYGVILQGLSTGAVLIGQRCVVVE